MSDDTNDSDCMTDGGLRQVHLKRADILAFGDFAVLAPGVQIILEGRPVSHFGR